MNSTNLLIIAISIILSYTILRVVVVFPAWKKYKIQEAKASLAKCFRILNEGPLPSGKICDGHYLHDSFYRLLLSSLITDDIVIKSVSNIRHNEDEEKRRIVFRSEVNALDDETKQVVNSAIVSIGWIVFFQNMILFPISILKCNQARHEYKQQISDQMMRSGEYVAVNQRFQHEDCHA